MQGIKIRLLASGLLMMVTAGYVQADVFQSDPAWQQGTLSNGSQWQVLTTPQRPSDRVEIRLLVNTGSLTENTQQSGYSHVIPRIAPTQSGGLDVAQACSLWQQGINPKRPTPSVIVSYDTMLFNSSLPNNRNDLLKKVLSYLANVIGKLTTTPGTINHALRSQDMVATWPADTKKGWWRYRLKGSTLLGHDPADPLKQLVEVEKIKDSHQKWYAPDAMTLLVVGSVDTRSVVDQIDETFGELKGRREIPAPMSMLSPLRAETVSITTDAVRQDRLSIVWDTPRQPIHESAALLRYWRADLAHEVLFQYAQQALSASNNKDIGLGFDCRVLYPHVQRAINIESPNDKLNSNFNLVTRELARVRDKDLPEEEFNALVAQKRLELQKLFVAYTWADADTLIGQRMRSLQDQVVDIAPEQYQKLRQDFLNSLMAEMLNQDLCQRLSNDVALILLQPKDEPEFDMKALQVARDRIMAPSTAVAVISVAVDDVHFEVTDIPLVQ